MHGAFFQNFIVDSIINEITRTLNIAAGKTNNVVISLYYIFGLHFLEATIRVRDFFIHRIKFYKLKN